MLPTGVEANNYVEKLKLKTEKTFDSIIYS
jgi:hypothetical protein